MCCFGLIIMKTGQHFEYIFSGYLTIQTGRGSAYNSLTNHFFQGRHEFYRFMPHENPTVQIFPVKGMNINVRQLFENCFKNLKYASFR